MITIVIPNFNGAKLLAKNLPKLIGLLEQAKLENEIILSDDASSDDSIAEVKRQNLKVKIVENPKNLGFASTVDRGIRKASGKIVFTLKTDALPESSEYFGLMLKHFYSNLAMKQFSNDRVFAVSAALKTVEKGKEEVRGNGVIYFERGFFLHRRGPSTSLGTSLGTSLRSAWADGGAMAVRKDLYLKIGGLDGLFDPFYWEDVDLGYRAWKAGYQIDFEPKAVLIHDFESGAIAENYTKKQIKLISLRNQFIFARKNTDLKHRILYILWKPYHDLVALKNRDWLFFAAWWQATLRLPGILAARARQKAVSQLSDDEVLSKVG